jgi:hypothetical protein
MSTTRSATYALGASAAMLLLVACGSNGLQAPSASFAFDLRNPARFYLGVTAVGRIHRDHGRSWIAPDVANVERLLFAGDAGSGDVHILALPDMAEKGRITGFGVLGPEGECTDRQGNVYIADPQAQSVYEYSRGGMRLATYTNTNGYPESCAVNPINGHLAVTNLITLGARAGEVLVYSSPSAAPVVLKNPQQYAYYFAGYGRSGELWVDGLTESNNFILSHCSASSCTTIKLSGGTIYAPGAVAWDEVRKTWVVFDQECNNTTSSCSYPVSKSFALGTPTKYSNFDGTAACDIVQGVIPADGSNKYIAGGDNEDCGFSANYFGRWAYTAGGKPTNHTKLNLIYPSGAAISKK